MYSRSYGVIEQGEKSGMRISVPPDYNGNLYRKAQEKEPSDQEEAVVTQEKPPQVQRSTAPLEEKPPSAPSGIAGGFLERLTAEDILLFIFLYSLIRGDAEESGNILGLILALLLL